MDIVFFVIRYTPFWSIPVIFIAGYFTYTYWIKDIRIVSAVFSFVGLLALLLLLYWIVVGGPDASVQQILQFSQ
ncbi:hypothetical protein [Halobacteriovorax sp. JY17]|uniref:hypothetical protein n=1 Tax=Halobacteriovorax sp. JY17 TaxID=2014617 RepID=UPI000C679AD7|nr:hypothetical protein [Halobacteriovorax sp. JY17]PIK13863.1 MAG: hypothetical protein CES88_12820 [Halobacteriovorax sp. JY17]